MDLFKPIRKFFGNLGVSSFLSGWNSVGRFTRQEFVYQYKNYVYPCVGSIAEEAAKVQWFVNQIKPDGNKVKIPNHEILQLLQNPNPDTTGFQLIEMHQTFMELEGEMFWYMPYGEVSRKPKQIYLLKGSQMDVAVSETDNTVAGYVFNDGKGHRIPLTKEEIIPHKLPNPKNPLRGMGVIEAGMDYIQTEQVTAKWSKNFMANNAMPTGIVSFNGKITQEDFEKIKGEWARQYGGPNNAGKTAFIRNSEIEFTKIGSGYSDIALKDLKDISKEDIMFMFRVSKPILGIVDDVALNNGKNARRIFLENVVTPKVDRIRDALQAYLVPRFGTNLEIGFESIVPEDKVEKASYLNNAAYMTINEKRAKDDLPAIESTEANSVLIPINMIPAGEPASPQGKILKLKIITKKLIPTPPTPLPAHHNHSHDKKKIVLQKEAKENFRVMLYRTAREWEKKFANNWNNSLEDERKEVVRRIKSKAVTKAFEDWIPDENESAKAFSRTIEPLILELMMEQGQLAIDLLALDLKFELSENVKNYVAKRVGKFVPESVKARKEALVQTLTEGLSNGESLSKLVNRVNDVYKTEKSYKTERVARTETSFASNKSAVEAYYQSGVVSEKEWFANPNCCEYCAELDGKKIGLAENYYNLGDPIQGADGGQLTADFEDIGEPPVHPNCECTILPV